MELFGLLRALILTSLLSSIHRRSDHDALTSAATYREFLDLLLQLCDQTLLVFQFAVQVVDLRVLPVNKKQTNQICIIFNPGIF